VADLAERDSQPQAAPKGARGGRREANDSACGVPSSLLLTSPSFITPALSQLIRFAHPAGQHFGLSVSLRSAAYQATYHAITYPLADDGPQIRVV
jgi:hypothetical protein